MENYVYKRRFSFLEFRYSFLEISFFLVPRSRCVVIRRILSLPFNKLIASTSNLHLLFPVIHDSLSSNFVLLYS